MSPSPTQASAVLVAAAAVADVVQSHPAAGHRERAILLLDAAGRHAAACEITRLDRRLAVYASSWANTYLRTFSDPSTVTVLSDPATRPLPREVAALQREVFARVPGADGDGIHPLDMRLVRVTADGVVIDQLTSSQANAVATDRFTMRAVAAHLALGAALLTDLDAPFAGVRVLAPRAPRRSLHVLPDRSHHLAGCCPACITPEVLR